jgi:protein-S-isoprenylcysteine O-methyltransferase Ste14
MPELAPIFLRSIQFDGESRMALVEELQDQGDWLFRWRSYLPFMLVALIGVAFRYFDWPLHSYALHEVWSYLSLVVSLLGLVIRAITVAHAPARTSGRNAKHQIADQLNTSGMYSIVRHPLYLGNYLIGLGISLVLLVWWLPLIYSLLFWLYYERIMFAEEAFLRRKFGEPYQRWAAMTPAFVPRVTQWRRAELPFSLRNVLRREYSGLMIVILGHAGIELTEHLIMDRRVVWEVFWAGLLFGGIATYFVLRLLKRRTSLLDVPGR